MVPLFARHAAAKPMTQSTYWTLSSGLATRTSSVTASGASAANSGRHRPRSRPTHRDQTATAAAMRTRHSLDASSAIVTSSPLSCIAPYRYTTAPCHPACRQIRNGVAATDSISTSRAPWCARKLIVGPRKATQVAASTAAAAARTRRRWPGAAPASSVTGHAFTAAPAPIRRPRTPPRLVTLAAATEIATGMMSSLPIVIVPGTGTAHTQYQAPASDPPRRGAAHRRRVTARSQPMASSVKLSV